MDLFKPMSHNQNMFLVLILKKYFWPSGWVPIPGGCELLFKKIHYKWDSN